MEDKKITLKLPFDLDKLLTEDVRSNSESKTSIILNILYKHYDDIGRLFDEMPEPINQNVFPLHMYRRKSNDDDTAS